MANVVPQRLDEARTLLQRHFGYADFRPAQRRVVQSVLAGRDTLAVLPTGGGKSICFQLPALVLGGFTIVVSPLISLMQDQVAALRARGISAALLNSSLTRTEQHRVLEEVVAGQVPLLYTSPERLSGLAASLRQHRVTPRLLAIDEAHCITEWGHDFRPAYRALRRLRFALGKPPVVALTGSATPEVRQDITAALGLRRPDLHLGSFDRPNLWFGVVRIRDERERLERLLSLLRQEDRLAIVYAPTRNTAEGLTRALNRAGFRAAPYHAGLNKAGRVEVLRRFLEEDLEVVTATCAFGMGIDQPRVRLVVHWTMPPTPESYYQEAGRAGRDGGFARCVLLAGRNDAVLHHRQLEVTFPPKQLLQRIWYEKDGRRGVPANVLASADRLSRELHPERGSVDWRPVEARRQKAAERIAAVESYAEENGCRRAALLRYFGETLGYCSGCGRCRKRLSEKRLDPVAAGRYRRLLRIFSGGKAPWGGALIEPEVLRRLAESPPDNSDQLAAVPGVGSSLAERLGAIILGGLETEPTAESSECPPLHQALRNWRRTVADGMGVPDYSVLPDAVLARIAQQRPQDRDGLRVIEGLGPRALAKWGDTLLSLSLQ